MPFVFKRLALIMSIAAAFAADKEQPFHPPAAAGMAHHQANGSVTIGAEPYVSGDKVKAAFGKNEPYQFGMLPVLVVIQNDGADSIKLDKMKAEYVSPSGLRVDATPAKDVRYAHAGQRPTMIPTPVGTIKKMKGNPLDNPAIEVHALAAPIVLAGKSASGFLYFQTGFQPGSTLYLTGMTEAGSGKELLYFEIPLQ